jgi:HSP20 family molecular chaperone IbpA
MSTAASSQSTPPNGTSPERTYRRRSVAPPVDVYENADELLVVADVPGVTSEAIALTIENDTLTLKAHQPHADEEPTAIVRELGQTSFEASFRIPAGIDVDKIVAETKNGTVVVRLPKSERVKARAIVVR